MKRNTFFIICLATLLLQTVGCKTPQSKFKLIGGGTLPVSHRDRTSAKSVAMDSILLSYKTDLDQTMMVVIAVAGKDYPKTAPEYAIQNIAIKAMMEEAHKELGKKVDGAIMNVDGVRGNLSKGNITLGKAFSLFPFDNQLLIITIQGRFLKELMIPHREISKIVTTDFDNYEDDRLYTIATIDYVAEGNDDCDALRKATKEHKTTLTLRDLMINYFKNNKL